MQKFPLIIMAGSDPKSENVDDLETYSGEHYKALIKIKNEPIINIIIRKFVKSQMVSSIHIFGLPKEACTMTSYEEVPIYYYHEAGTHFDKLLIASEQVNQYVANKSKPYALFTSGDIPSIEPEAITDFVQRCVDQDNLESDMYFSLIPQEVMVSLFPSSNRTYAPFKEGRHCGGDVHLGRLDAIKKNEKVIRNFISNRKSILKQALWISPWLTIKLFLRRLSIPELTQLGYKLSKSKISFIPSPYATLGFDIDKPHQLDLLNQLLNEGKISIE